MREIKFRGRRLDYGRENGGQWVYGSLVKLGTKMCIKDWSDKNNLIRIDGTNIDADVRCVEVDPKTVGQYVGLTNKNKTDIYEGDILRDHVGVGKVTWVQEHCAFLVFTTECGGSVFHYLRSGDSNFKLKDSLVIGNIHENPELMGG